MSTDKTQNLSPPPRYSDVDYPHRELTQEIIGAAYEVHRELGPGFLEKVYETALIQELVSHNVKALPQAEVPVRYKAQTIGLFYPDILVKDKVICEIKAVERLSPAHEAQLLHYLKATGIKVGLLLNFGSKRLEVKRLVF